jgi:hypothetical protein
VTIPLPPVPGPEITPRQLLTPPWQSWFSQLYVYLTAPSSGGGGTVPASRAINTTAPLTGGGTLAADRTLSIAANGITNALLAQMPGLTIKGNNTGVPATPLDLTIAQVAALLAGNPTAQVGLAAINGVAATFMRSDAAPALNVGISPTWSGTHTFSNIITAAGLNLTGATLPANGVYLSNTNEVGIAANSAQVGRITALGFLSVAGGYLLIGSPGGGGAGSRFIGGQGNTTDWVYNALTGGLHSFLINAVETLRIANHLLTITGSAAGTAAVAVNTSGNTGANTLTPTWTNFPGTAGTKNPASWLPITIDGNLRYIPCFS